jgi:FG-GAP repeat protein
VIDLRSSTLKHVFLSLLSFLFFLKEFSMKTNQNNKCHYFRSFASRMNAGVLVVGVALAGLGVQPCAGQTIHEDLKLLASDGEAQDNFGWAIAIDDGLVVGSASGSAYVFNALTGAQIAKLLPNDGGAFQGFGKSIAIDDGIVAVGAPGNDDNGRMSGSAYIFNASTGEQIAKLLPSDGAADDQFGFSVAIDNGVVAVGATGDRTDDNGGGAGAAYLFEASTGAQITKIVPDDRELSVYFGYSIALDGIVFDNSAVVSGVVAVGAYRDNDNGIDSGSAYIFNASTGVQAAKLLPSDGDWFDYFGISIDIDNGVVAVGASGDDDNGSASGSAYLFRKAANGWPQIAKLRPNDGAELDSFGHSIAIDDGIIAVGAPLNDDNGFDSGSAYFFDAGTGTQIAKLLPSDGAYRDNFGYSVAIDKGIIAAGAIGDGDNGPTSGSAYVFAVDSDGDGLYDFWEINGIDIDGDLNIDLDLPALGADPQRKDLFLEIDAMLLMEPQEGVVDRVVQAFANAPVSNPDGTTGITLHAAVDENNLSQREYPKGFFDFALDKYLRFGTVAERDHPNSEQILAAKRLVYRYCIFAKQHSGGSWSGLAELGGNDLMVTLGHPSRNPVGGTPDQQAGTLLHEFGHTLNLRHGGGDKINFKPNYYSVMSYTWQSPKTGWESSWRLDYSRETLPTLNESALIEPDGLGANLPGIKVPYTSGNRGSFAKMGPDEWVDWNLDQTNDQNTVAVDINYLYRGAGWQASPGQMLIGHNDWANLQFNFRDSRSFVSGVHIVPDDELSLEIEDALEELFPPECSADLNGDGVLDLFDVSAFLSAFSAQDPIADFTGDGLFDFFDVQAFLNAYAAGCP